MAPAKRIGARQLAADMREAQAEAADAIVDELHPQPDRDLLAALGYDVPDCLHGCNGSPCGAEQCTFACHPATWKWIDCPACGNDPEERKTCRVCRGSGQIEE